MTVRTPLAAALALVLVTAAAPSATAQHVVYHHPVVYHPPVIYHTPVVYHPPVMYHQPVYTYNAPVVQSGQWTNGSVVGRSVGVGRLWDKDAGWGGFPFDARPGLNIAYRLLTR